MLALAGAVLALVTAPRVARAEPSQRVSIRVPAHVDALLEEALVRVRGELGAMGLEADVRQSANGGEPAPTLREGGVGGTLVVERDGAWIRIRAFGPALAVPAVQELDTRRSDVTAEVVAVRAVEALRAVMAGLPERRPTPPRTAAAKPSPPPPKPPRPSAGKGSLASLAPRGESSLSLWAGASAYYDLEPQRPALGAELGAFWGRSSFFAGALLSTSLLRTALHDAVGQVYVRRSTALARLGVTLELSQSAELWLMAGGGVARFGVQGKAATGYVGVTGQHDSPVLAAGVGGTGWLSRYLGAYLRLEASLATDPPAARVAQREIAVLERPTLGASLGVVVRAP